MGPREPFLIEPSALVSPIGGPRRTPPRPAELREPDYLEKYDDSTVFYDVFRCGRGVMAVGPPAGSLLSDVRRTRVTSSAGSSRFSAPAGFDRVGRFWASPPRSDASSHLSVTGELTTSPVPVVEDLAGYFRGRRAVMTLSRDNDLEWIAAWGQWYSSRHGADALVVYDNGSSLYSPAELWAVLSTVPGVAVAAVVAWPFKYGPIGQHPTHLYDSNYAQHGALEHARWRLLRQASGFLGVDVDELVPDSDGRSVFEAAQAAPSGAVQLPGRWTYPDPTTPADRRPRHTDSYWIKVKPPDAASPPKWCVIPARLPRAAQLTVHEVVGVRAERRTEFTFWHLLHISTNWYGGRNVFHVNPETYRVDQALKDRHERGISAREHRSASGPVLRARLTYLPHRIRCALRRGRTRLRDTVNTRVQKR